MSKQDESHFEQLPDELQPVADWLRAQRPEVSAVDLDRLKLRAQARARGSAETGTPLLRSRRGLSTAIAVLALVVSASGALAIAGKGPPSSILSSGSSKGSAAISQYTETKNTHGGGNNGKGTKGVPGDGNGAHGAPGGGAVLAADSQAQHVSAGGLPFTGFDLFLIALAGAVVLGAGLTLRAMIGRRDSV